MTRLKFRAGETQREGQNFRKKLILDCKKYLELVHEDQYQNRVYNVAQDKSTLTVDYFLGHVPDGLGEEDSVVLTGGIIVGPQPERVLSRLEKMTGIKLITEKENDR